MEGQARPDIRARVRGNVTRIRARHTAIRVRIAVATINHTAYGKLYQFAKLLIRSLEIVEVIKWTIVCWVVWCFIQICGIIKHDVHVF